MSLTYEGVVIVSADTRSALSEELVGEPFAVVTARAPAELGTRLS